MTSARKRLERLSRFRPFSGELLTSCCGNAGFHCIGRLLPNIVFGKVTRWHLVTASLLLGLLLTLPPRRGVDPQDFSEVVEHTFIFDHLGKPGLERHPAPPDRPLHEATRRAVRLGFAEKGGDLSLPRLGYRPDCCRVEE
jgi:hypothetical protein